MATYITPKVPQGELANGRAMVLTSNLLLTGNTGTLTAITINNVTVYTPKVKIPFACRILQATLSFEGVSIASGGTVTVGIYRQDSAGSTAAKIGPDSTGKAITSTPTGYTEYDVTPAKILNTTVQPNDVVYAYATGSAHANTVTSMTLTLLVTPTFGV